jgi:glycosyltransferase involved in cell wall biosynthesis
MARRSGCRVTLNLANALPLAAGPHAVVIHDATVFEHPEWFAPAYRLWHGKVLRPALRRAAAVGTLSRDAARSLARILDLTPESIAVIAQGAAPLDAPAGAAAVAEIRRRWGIAGPYLLATGAADPRKNVHFLEEALARWPTSGGAPTAPALVVVGGRSRVFAPSRNGAGPSAAPRVVRTGRVDDDTLRALYTGATAFCFPSLAEGFGRPPLEALACGTPVVAAPYGPAREVLGDAAAIVPLEADAWTEVLLRLVREGAPPGSAARARAVVEANRWEDGAGATLELCARAAAAGA